MLKVMHHPRPPRAGNNRSFGQPFAALAEPGYQALWLSILGSYSAMQMNIVARGYLAFMLTNSAVALGVVSVARAIPMLVLAPYAGVMADRADKRKTLILTQVVLMGVALTTSLLVHAQVIQIWHLVVLAMIEGTFFTFNMPARQSILPELVSPGRLGNAVALNASGRNLTRIVAPSLAGFMLTMPLFGVSGAFDCVAAFYAIAALLLLRLPVRPKASARPSTAPARSGGLSSMSDGFRYILGHSNLRLLIVLGFIPVLLGMPYQTLLPVFQARVLNVDAQGLGIMYAAAGVGGLIGTLVVASVAVHPKKALLQLAFGVMFGLSLLLFATIHIFALDLVFLGLAGLAGDGYSTLNSTMVMLNTERAWYGRVMSIYMMNFALMPLATLPLGGLSDAFGAPLALGGAAIIIVLVVGGVGLFYPPYRKVGEVTVG
ncbi:MAG: MFS transporter, partial [Chloroflexota bacterium]